MLHTHTLTSQPPQITVRFEDGAHSFQLAKGATLTELANRIGVLGAQHDGAPISIDIEFNAPCTWSMPHSQPRCQLTNRNRNRGMKTMDKDRIKGTAQKIKGRIEKTVGRLVGSKSLETDGKIDEAAGNVRKAVGEAKDVVRDAVKDRTK